MQREARDLVEVVVHGSPAGKVAWDSTARALNAVCCRDLKFLWECISSRALVKMQILIQ